MGEQKKNRISIEKDPVQISIEKKNRISIEKDPVQISIEKKNRISIEKDPVQISIDLVSAVKYGGVVNIFETETTWYLSISSDSEILPA